MRVLAIDYGDARTGIAVSDLSGTIVGQTEVILGIIGTLVLAECCRRAVGLPILVVAGCFVLYAFIGRGMSLDLVVYNIFYTTNGIIGTPISVCSTYIALFLLLIY